MRCFLFLSFFFSCYHVQSLAFSRYHLQFPRWPLKTNEKLNPENLGIFNAKSLRAFVCIYENEEMKNVKVYKTELKRESIVSLLNRIGL